MKLIVKSELYNGSPSEVESECKRYGWIHFNKNHVYDRIAAKAIYQMDYVGESDTVPKNVRIEVEKFWIELIKLQQHAKKTYEEKKLAKYKSEESDNFCRKCQSYCWGDCEANE
jgi:hypothetical protein